MTLAVVKQNGRILIAHAIQGHGAADIRILAADYVTGRDINHVLALVGQEALHLSALESHGGPSGKKDGVLKSCCQRTSWGNFFWV